MKANISILTLIVYALIFTACDRHRNHPGWDYFPDMFYSTAYETYSENPNFTDSMTMRVPPSGSIPRGYIPFDYTIAPESRKKAGDELVNPIENSSAALERGQKEFEIFCAVCHGFKGEGDGTIFTLGLYPMKPRPLSGPSANVLRDGEIFHTITLGFGSMGSYASQIQPDDRWKIILHIRQLQK